MFKKLSQFLGVAFLLASCLAPVDSGVETTGRDELLGRAGLELAKRTPDGLQTAAGLYRQLTEAAPDEARGWAGLAESAALLGLYGVLIPSEVMPEAGSAAARALALDPENALIQAVRGLVQYLHDWNWIEAEASFNRAIEIDPARVESYHWSAMMFSATGRHDEALTRIRKASALHPESPLLAVKVGTIRANAGQFEEARATLESASARFPSFSMAWNELGLLSLRELDNRRAANFFSKALRIDAGSDRALAGLAVAWSRLGDPEAFQEMAERLRLLAKESYVSPTILAELSLAEGSVSRALEELERGFQTRDPGLVYLLTRPGLAPLREEPRLRELVIKIGLRKEGWFSEGLK